VGAEGIRGQRGVVGLAFWEARVRATGKVVRSDFAVAFTVRKGKVTRWQAYYDTSATAAAFTAVSKASV
jgi:ketosteroid isomerase-like protein